MTNELFTSDGNRKYLNAAELDAFVLAAANQERAEVRTFCLVMAHTGCRISEALALTPSRIDLAEQAITFRTLKQRDTLRYRAVPVPASTLDALVLAPVIKRG
jgi:integrase